MHTYTLTYNRAQTNMHACIHAYILLSIHANMHTRHFARKQQRGTPARRPPAGWSRASSNEASMNDRASSQSDSDDDMGWANVDSTAIDDESQHAHCDVGMQSLLETESNSLVIMQFTEKGTSIMRTDLTRADLLEVCMCKCMSIYIHVCVVDWVGAWVHGCVCAWTYIYTYLCIYV